MAKNVGNAEFVKSATALPQRIQMHAIAVLLTLFLSGGLCRTASAEAVVSTPFASLMQGLAGGKAGPKLTQDQIDEAVAKDLKELEGLWILEKTEGNGREPYWVPRYDGIYIEKSAFQSTKKNGEIPGGSDGVGFVIDPTKGPKTIDFKWRNDKYIGIYKIEGNRLIFAVKEQDVRPGVFVTALSAGAQRAVLMITYKRAPKD